MSVIPVELEYAARMLAIISSLSTTLGIFVGLYLYFGYDYVFFVSAPKSQNVRRVARPDLKNQPPDNEINKIIVRIRPFGNSPPVYAARLIIVDEDGRLMEGPYDLIRTENQFGNNIVIIFNERYIQSIFSNYSFNFKGRKLYFFVEIQTTLGDELRSMRKSVYWK